MGCDYTEGCEAIFFNKIQKGCTKPRLDAALLFRLPDMLISRFT